MNHCRYTDIRVILLTAAISDKGAMKALYITEIRVQRST